MHPRQVLRESLESLQTLSSVLMSEEAELERRHTERLSATEKTREKRLWDAQEWERKQRAAIAADAEQRLEQLARQREKTRKEAEATYRRAVAEAQHLAEEQRRKLRKAMEEGAWLAESLLEGAQAAATKALKDADDALSKTLGELHQRASRHAELLSLYGMQHLVLESPPAVSAEVAVTPTMDERHAREALGRVLERLTGLERTLEGLELARMYVGLKPYGLGAAVVLAGAVVGQLSTFSRVLDPLRVAVGAGVGLVLALAAGVGLKAVANRQVRAAYLPIRQAMEDARGWAELVRQLAIERVELDRKAAAVRRDEELRLVRERHQPRLDQVERQLKDAVAAAQARRAESEQSAERAWAEGVAAVEAQRESRLAELERRVAAEREKAIQEAQQATAEAQVAYASGKADLERRWNLGLTRIAEAMQIGRTVSGAAAVHWPTYRADVAALPQSFSPVVRFGQLTVSVRELELAGGWSPGVAAGATWRFGDVLPERFTVPAVLGYGVGATPEMGNLMLDFDRGGREPALQMLRAVMANLLVSMPPGRVRLTMVDPVGLGKTFAGFMHLADYDEQLTGPRIWSETEAIERRLSDLTEHMETVIQKYLRNEFDTIDRYNAQAGELAEPYRFLVVADFPTGWSTESLRKLGSVLTSGARCGVHVLMARDVRVPLEKRVLEDVRAGVTSIEVEAGTGDADVPAADGATSSGTEGSRVAGLGGFVRLRWRDVVFGRFELAGDAEPSDATLTALCRAVGEGARRASRVEVDVAAVLPPPDQRWTWSAAEEFRVPLGRSGATRLQYLRLGKGVSQHALLAGKTGSGKSTLLHVLVTAAALWYPPDEVEFYLIDFKKGVEFKTYVDGRLPHVRAVAVESDREFGLSVLQRLDAELTRRGELLRRAGVQDLAAYRELRMPGEKLPRVLLVVDEFQEFFADDDKLAQEAAALLDRLVRQGRAFGMHVILGSQTLGGSAGLPRATLGQMAVRIALQTSEADSTLILGDGNTAARLLTRPGEAIYNDNGGLPEANSPFQVAWLSEVRRDALLSEINSEATRRGWRYDAVVFEGNKPADLREAREFQRLRSGRSDGAGGRGVCLIGEPVAIKTTTHVELRRQPGANVLLIGQQDEAALATLQASLLSLSLAEPDVRLVVLEGTVEGSPLRGGLTRLPEVAERLGLPLPDVIDVPYREAEAAVGRVHAELKRRLELTTDQTVHLPRLVLVIYGLQRYRGLRRSDGDFAFGLGGADKPPSPDRMLAELAREGPPLGVHVLCWADTLTAVERVFERGVMREFDHRVLFQMGANDSSALIDSPAANRLGPFRGLLFSEEQGTLEKFRPFATLGV